MKNLWGFDSVKVKRVNEVTVVVEFYLHDKLVDSISHDDVNVKLWLNKA